MEPPTNAGRSYPSTYFVHDRSSAEELNRLHLQDELVTAGMGGILPEQPDPTLLRSILDIGCGTGGWLIEAAKTFPSLSRLVGVDASPKMISYATAQAQVAGQQERRLQFRQMDALRLLEFPDASFDLVNLRFGASFLRTWEWPRLLGECQRVCRAGGVIRITEAEMMLSSSPALSRISEVALEALYQAGHFFTPERDGLISELAALLHTSGVQNVQTQRHTLHYRAETRAGQAFAEDMKHLFRTTLPFMRKWGRVPADYEAIYQQMLLEMSQPDFEASWTLLTAWGHPIGSAHAQSNPHPR
ncbi:MAG TPA: class I SAM-dependent methyltransferase [Ktedonosporobacter sp.]|nr:class I SAM-dependent methyltransferase [Ktedonosporobacter sp.]